MHDDRRFPFEKMARLDSPERLARQPAAALVELVTRLGPRRVLDLGAGTGYLALPLAAALPGGQVLALDVEPRMLEVIRTRAAERALTARVTPVLAPADALPLPDAEIDVALMVNLFHELPARAAYLAETWRVLRPGGTLIICDWDPAGDAEAGPPLDHRVPRDTASAELNTAGFSAVEGHALYANLWTLSARRSTPGEQ